MADRLEIEIDQKNMAVRVGTYVMDRPDFLIPRPEYWFDLKERIVGDDIDRPVGDPKALNKYYSDRLGPKFYRRLQAAQYELWLKNKMLLSSTNMLRIGGRQWRFYSHRLVYRASTVWSLINQAERDGLHHLIPAIVVWNKSPQDIKREIGKGMWKRIAGHSRTMNVRLMQVAAHSALESDLATDGWPKAFLRAMEFPRWSHFALQGVGDADLLAARLCESHDNQDFWDLVMTVSDTKRMLNGHLNMKWTLAQLNRAHEDARRELRRRDFSDQPFASDWSYSSKGFTAKLLTSEIQIAVEGDEMHHCVASYASTSQAGHYAVLTIQSATERATCGLTRSNGMWAVQQVYRACNEPVSLACREFAIEASAMLTIQPFMAKAA